MTATTGASLNVNSVTITGAHLMKTWRGPDGTPCASVQFGTPGHSWITYKDPAIARAVAAAHIAAAEALEAAASLCPECEALLPGHMLGCPRREVPAYAAGGGGA